MIDDVSIRPAIVFDAMGVLYTDGDDVASVLIPYLRELGCILPQPKVIQLYREASLGLLTTDEFWDACGIDGDDQVYCQRHQLSSGMAQLLADLHQAGFKLGCLSNDVSEWSLILRERFGLTQWIGTWAISGDIAVRKPDEGAFRTLAEMMDQPLESIVYFDDLPKNIKAAQDLGMNAIQFTSVAACRALIEKEFMEETD
ncbi:MAG: HAD-IA family hydrolase [Propionibacteriaceae bacterium]|nr:HAD-IA family hydrolase [Propionibacteriaceae bacterium]